MSAFDSEETRTLGLNWGNSALSVHYRDRLGANGLFDANVGTAASGATLSPSAEVTTPFKTAKWLTISHQGTRCCSAMAR